MYYYKKIEVNITTILVKVFHWNWNKEIYRENYIFKKKDLLWDLYYVIMEANKYYDISSISWKMRKASRVIQSEFGGLRTRRETVLTLSLREKIWEWEGEVESNGPQIMRSTIQWQEKMDVSAQKHRSCLPFIYKGKHESSFLCLLIHLLPPQTQPDRWWL